MALCFSLGVLAGTLCGVFVFLLGDGGVRRAVHLVLASRLGGFFRPRLIIVGDSLAAGCPWWKLDSRPFAALNLAEGGATLKQIAGQIYRARAFADAQLLINGGLNDLLFDRVSLDQFETDCQALLRRISPHERVIVTLMPFTADPGDASMIEAANASLSRLCLEQGYRTLDLNECVSLNGVRKPEMTNDGLHFTRVAEMVWIGRVKALLD